MTQGPTACGKLAAANLSLVRRPAATGIEVVFLLTVIVMGDTLVIKVTVAGSWAKASLWGTVYQLLLIVFLVRARCNTGHHSNCHLRLSLHSSSMRSF